MKILVGCDPEVFVKKNNKFVSAHGLISGDKKNPQRVRNGAVQVDGMALEFNIDPAVSEDDFCLKIQDVYTQMKMMVPQYDVVATPVAEFGFKYLKEQPKEALELGCDPDFNGWTGVVNPRPDGERPFRTASGHIHIGWTNGQDIESEDHRATGMAIVKQLDFFVGLPSLLFDGDTKRREMYGKAGACRFKPYGVEYRTLSNVWLQKEKLMRWVYRSTINGVNALISGNDLSDKYGNIEEIINTSNIKEANKIIKQEKLEVCLG